MSTAIFYIVIRTLIQFKLFRPTAYEIKKCVLESLKFPIKTNVTNNVDDYWLVLTV